MTKQHLLNGSFFDQLKGKSNHEASHHPLRLLLIDDGAILKSDIQANTICR
jgi:hypothetical protein